MGINNDVRMLTNNIYIAAFCFHYFELQNACDLIVVLDRHGDIDATTLALHIFFNVSLENMI